MEISSIIFLEATYMFSVLYCIVGFQELLLSNSESDHPLPYAVICAVVYPMTLFTFISSTYGFLIKPLLGNESPDDHMSGDLVSHVLKDWLYMCFMFLGIFIPWRIHLLFSIRNSPFRDIFMRIVAFRRISRVDDYGYLAYWHTFYWVNSSVSFVFSVPIFDRFLGSFLCLMVCLLLSVIHLGLDPVGAYLWLKEGFNRLGTWSPFIWIYGIRKIMKFALGMVGTILFHYSFKYASTHQLVAFLSFAMAWLGNIAMVQPSTDFGIFDFILVNACVGFSVSVFNLDIRTWLVSAVCLNFYFLRLKSDSVTFTSLARRIEELPLTVSLPPHDLPTPS